MKFLGGRFSDIFHIYLFGGLGAWGDASEQVVRGWKFLLTTEGGEWLPEGEGVI